MPAHGAEWVVVDGEVLRPGRVGLSRSVAATRTARIGAELPVVEALRSGKWPTSDARQVGSEGWCGAVRGRLPAQGEQEWGPLASGTPIPSSEPAEH
jgi:hypothetical protein